jgi:hypothetical protein
MPRLSKIGAAALAAFGWTGGASVSASYLVVAGGGGGAGESSSNAGGGGGGAGGYRTGTASLNPTLSYTVTVGAGGNGGPAGENNGSSGSDSVFNSVTSTGGGYGAKRYTAGGNGGSGGGGGLGTGSAGGNGNTPSTSPSQGNNGGSGVGTSTGGGGGGASASGSNAPANQTGGNGGAGTTSSITGSSVTYAGGGGAGGTTIGTGGAGGGGNGGNNSNGVAGTANLGGGGGGAYDQSSSGRSGGNGGSGVVIISYPAPQQFGGGVVTTSGSNVIHTFNTSGTLSPLSTLTASYLVVAGGGACVGWAGGGGGAGGLLTGSSLTIDTNSNYIVTVGAGGAGGSGASATSPSATQDGSISSFSGVSVTATGGGSGGGYTGNARTGGSGGGGGNGSGTSNYLGAAGTSGQGNTGGNALATYSVGGGGGGSSAVGGNATSTTGGNGGNGTTVSAALGGGTYAGGGGGGANATSAGTGGSGGGGNGANGAPSTQVAGTSGTANTGGGGGGGSNWGSTSVTQASGGSGVVIISYAGSTQQMAGGTVTISGGNVIHTFTSSGYLTPIKLVNNSLRFRNSVSAYLNRTPTTAGNLQKWTWSGWVKRGKLGSPQQTLFSAQSTTTANLIYCYFSTTDALTFYQYSASGATTDSFLGTTQVFRDPAAWYHIVVAVDTTQATAANRTIIYVNGVQVTSFSSATYFTQNTNTYINSTNPQNIARNPDNSSYFDGYLAETQLIDGQQLTPTSFGTINSYGVWQPITYGGSYGTNGFYLPFSNTASPTTLAYDFSPNGNNWTPNNISTTAGATYDSMTDVPTLTSATAANYCTWNPLFRFSRSGGFAGTFSDGNLKVATGGNSTQFAGTLELCDGAYYEVTAVSIDVNRSYIGLFSPSLSNLVTSSTNVAYDGTYNVLYSNNGEVFVNTSSGSNVFGTFSSWTDGDVISVAYKSGKIYLAKNGVWQNSGVPASGTGFVASGWDAYGALLAYCGFNSTFSANFGQQPFNYTPPTGFVGVNTYNL